MGIATGGGGLTRWQVSGRAIIYWRRQPTQTSQFVSSVSLTTGPVSQRLAHLTIPMIGGILAMMAFNIADTWFVAQLGALELAAMSFTFPVVFSLISVGIGMMAGTSSVLARAVGAGDWERVRRVTTDAAVLAFALSLCCSVAGLLTLEPLFRLLGADESVVPLIAEYMVIWYCGYALVLVPMVGLGAVRATGDSVLQARIMGLAALVNLVLDPLLIFGLAGIPAFGLAGAAWATVLSRLLTLIVGYRALRRKGMLSFDWPGGRAVWRSWGAVMHVGAPATGTNLIVPVSNGVITALISSFGPAAVAGFGAASRIEQLSLVAYYALSASIGPFVGQNLGAGQHGRVAEGVNRCALFCIGTGLLLAVVLAVWGDSMMGGFSEDPAVVTVGYRYLLLVPVSFGAYGLVMVVNAAFNGAGRPLPAVSVSALRMLGLCLPLAWIGARTAGVEGIFAAISIANIVAGGVAWQWFRHACRAWPDR